MSLGLSLKARASWLFVDLSQPMKTQPNSTHESGTRPVVSLGEAKPNSALLSIFMCNCIMQVYLSHNFPVLKGAWARIRNGPCPKKICLPPPVWQIFHYRYNKTNVQAWENEIVWRFSYKKRFDWETEACGQTRFWRRSLCRSLLLEDRL